MRYRSAIVPKNCLFLSISQSGETADTLAALRQAKELGYTRTMTICNVPNSSLIRESDIAMITQAGQELGVASTKAFTSQLITLLSFTCLLSEYKGVKQTETLKQLLQLPKQIRRILALDENIQTIADHFHEYQNAIYLGRGSQYPIAMEGALKLKEISYIHAESYPAGELKHGPLALVDEHMPIVATLPNDALTKKTLSNLQEVIARHGQLYLFADESLKDTLQIEYAQICWIPTSTNQLFDPILYNIALQLLSYRVALKRGTDIDQPRNLAKSVTVE